MSPTNRLQYLFAGLYAWLSAVFFGAVLLDVVYASLIGAADASIGRSIFNEVSDILLLLIMLTILAALAALALAWNHPLARNLLLVSLFVLSLELVGPIILSPVLRLFPQALARFARLLQPALASLLALGAFRSLSQFRPILPPSAPVHKALRE